MNDDFQQPVQPPQQSLPGEPAPIAPPTPGQVINGNPNAPNLPTTPSSPSGPISAGPGTPPPPMPGGPMAPASSPPSGGGKRGVKAAIIAIVVLIVAIGGWFIYQQLSGKKKNPSTAVTHSDVDKINIGILNADFGKLYPNMSTTGNSYLVNAQLFNGLVKYEDADKIVPDLASKWSTPDDTTWLFTIRNDVKFHDGNNLTPADVKYSLEAVKAGNPGLSQAFEDTITTIDTVGKNQIKITTAKPDPALLSKLTYLYVVDAKAPQGSEPSQAGTGPYEIKSDSAPTSTSVQMTAYNDYFGGKPTTHALNFTSVDASSTLNTDFKAGKYDIVGPVSFSEAEAAPSGTTLFTSTRSDVYYVGFNSVKAGPLQNKTVREAIRYALSPDSIGDAHNVQITPDGQLVPATLSGYNASVKAYKQDTAKAKKLLTQAGYPDGLALTLSTAESSQATDEIVKELKDAGITATIDQRSDINQLVSSFNSGQDQMFVVDYGSSILDAGDIYANTLVNANYNNSQFTGLLTQASTEMNQSKRQKLFQDAAKIVDHDVAAVPLYTNKETWLMGKPYVIRQSLPNAALSVNFSTVQQ